MRFVKNIRFFSIVNTEITEQLNVVKFCCLLIKLQNCFCVNFLCQFKKCSRAIWLCNSLQFRCPCDRALTGKSLLQFLQFHNLSYSHGFCVTYSKNNNCLDEFDIAEHCIIQYDHMHLMRKLPVVFSLKFFKISKLMMLLKRFHEKNPKSSSNCN